MRRCHDSADEPARELAAKHQCGNGGNDGRRCDADSNCASRMTIKQQRIMEHILVDGGQVDEETNSRQLPKFERAWPGGRFIHVHVDNARHHHAWTLKPFKDGPECRASCTYRCTSTAHPGPLERYSGVMHCHVTHNRFRPNCRPFTDAGIALLNEIRRRERQRLRIPSSARIPCHHP